MRKYSFSPCEQCQLCLVLWLECFLYLLKYISFSIISSCVKDTIRWWRLTKDHSFGFSSHRCVSSFLLGYDLWYYAIFQNGCAHVVCLIALLIIRLTVGIIICTFSFKWFYLNNYLSPWLTLYFNESIILYWNRGAFRLLIISNSTNTISL